MTRNFSVSSRLNFKDPRVLARAAVGVLLAANLTVAIVLFKPWGGSAEDLARDQAGLEQQLAAAKAHLVDTKALVVKAERARQEGDQFLDDYTTVRRAAFSTIIAELERVAHESGVEERPISYDVEPVEGSDTLSQMTISAGYEGDYTGLTKFINLLDRSPRFLIIESLQAAPLQTNAANRLAVTIKLDTFVREQSGNPI